MAQFPSTTAADGIWTLKKVRRAILGDNWPPLVQPDQYFANTVLLLSGDGTSGAQNNTFLDSSTNNHTITRNGNVTQGSFSPFAKADGKWGNYFDGSGAHFDVSAGVGNTESTLTFESWIYMSSDPTFTTYDVPGVVTLSGAGSTVYFSFGVESSKKLQVYWFANSVGNSAVSTTVLDLHTWYHIALVVNSGSIAVYVNGVAETLTGSTTLDNRQSSNNNLQIGENDFGEFTGYISNARLTNTAVYTANFTPPTEPLTAISGTSLLTCQSNRFVDNSTNNFTISTTGTPEVTTFSPFAETTAYDPATKGGSGYFDGTGDYIRAAYDSSFMTSGSAFTVDFWFYPTASGDHQITGFNAGSGDSQLNWLIRQVSDNTMRFAVIDSSSSVKNIDSTSTFNLGQWNHVACVSDGSSALKMWLNGSYEGSAAYNGTHRSINGYIDIGDWTGAAGNEFEGYLSNFRYVVGTEVYTGTSAITVPTAPVTAITNTVLLTNFTNAGIADLTGSNVIETVGNAQVDTTTFKYGTGALEFDGTGDYITVPPNPLFEGMRTSEFTIEAWINLPDNDNRGFFHLADEYFASYLDGYIVGQNGTDRLFVTHSNTFTQQASIGYSLNTWFHIALVRNSSGILKLFVDGVEKISVTDTTSVTTSHLLIGGYYTTSNLMKGYIDDFRITKGIARYTANFTPPTAALPSVGE